MRLSRFIAPLAAAVVAVLMLGQAAYADLLIEVDKSAQRMSRSTASSYTIGRYQPGEMGASLAAQGIVTIVPDYSIFPPACFPMFVEDAARAVHFARESAAKWGGDPARLVLMGHSAGAYIAAMLSFDPQWLRQVGLNSRTDLAAFIGLAGPYDFLPIESKTLRTIFGGAYRAETQPISFVTGKEAPSLLNTARRDRLVSPSNSRRMAAMIHAHRGVVAERTYGGVGHLTLIGAFAPGLRVLTPVLRDVTQFVWRVTRRQADFYEVT
jgi:acetyl esterase/lipase